MNIDRITIQNFRNIENETGFSLDPKFTVIIGINGKGKSTILHAIRVACGAYFLGIPDVKKRHIFPEEIRVVDSGRQLIPKKPVKVEASGRFPGNSNSLVWRRQILENSNTTTSSEKEIGAIRRIGKENYEKVNSGNEKVELPVIAFFGTSRAHGAGRNRQQQRIGRQIFKEGYQDWFEMKSTTFKYENWLESYDVLQKSNKEYPNTKEAFFEAIKKANRYISEIENVSGKLWIKIGGDKFASDLLPIDIHSDGIRFYTEMVAELAYRCVVLNGHLDKMAVKRSVGIVMIDEIDLHLHPNWQKHVIEDLKNAFPSIQFIATTHSPFIVQSLKTPELINLDNVDGLDEDPYKYSIEEVSSKEMGVDHIERSGMFLEMQSKAKEYFDLIKSHSDKQSIAKAKEKLDVLRIKYSNDPAYVAFLESEFPKETK